MPTTRVELRRDGSRVVFHRKGWKVWTHPDDKASIQTCDVCQKAHSGA